MAAFITKRIITEVHPLEMEGEGEKVPLGKKLDDLILASLEAGHVLQSVIFEMEESEWQTLEKMFRERNKNSPYTAVEPARKVAR